MTIHLGIDPGTTRIGYGVIEDSPTGVRPLAWGVITTEPGTDASLAKQQVRALLTELIGTWRPASAAVERLFFMNNRRSAMSVGEMRGVIMLTLADHLIPTIEFTPLEIKQRVCGNGRAQKAQVEKMVRLVLGIRERITPDDAADALAIALCAAAASRPAVYGSN
ncbi:MAG TPA: crossover junction endodeoxyribonuclease RuvC [Candidatus Paceibacterota bacterium]|nr:crossover junction endodeoxyribonuclease RuvC [Candidatus Paceibacterota bacterium]